MDRGFVLNQPRLGLGQSPEEEYTGQDAWVEPSPSPVTSGASIVAGGSDFFSTVTSPDVVTAALNKYLFGVTAPIPTATTYRLPAPATANLITGVPNIYLLLGAGAALLLLAPKKRRA